MCVHAGYRTIIIVLASCISTSYIEERRLAGSAMLHLVRRNRIWYAMEWSDAFPVSRYVFSPVILSQDHE